MSLLEKLFAAFFVVHCCEFLFHHWYWTKRNNAVDEYREQVLSLTRENEFWKKYQAVIIEREKLTPKKDEATPV